jgi:hypothetical protein
MATTGNYIQTEMGPDKAKSTNNHRDYQKGDGLFVLARTGTIELWLLEPDTEAIVQPIAKDPDAATLVRLLEEAARNEDRQGFVEIVEATEWSTYAANELIRAVDLALSLDLVTVARALAQRGRRLFPDNQRLRHAGSVLEPSTSQVVESPDAPVDRNATFAWLEQQRGSYRDQWIAVRAGVLLGAAASLQELAATVDVNDPATLVTKML